MNIINTLTKDLENRSSQKALGRRYDMVRESRGLLVGTPRGLQNDPTKEKEECFFFLSKKKNVKLE